MRDGTAGSIEMPPMKRANRSGVVCNAAALVHSSRTSRFHCSNPANTARRHGGHGAGAAHPGPAETPQTRTAARPAASASLRA